MSALNLDNQGPRKKKAPENNRRSMWPFIFYTGIFIFMWYMMSQIMNPTGGKDSGVTAVPADYKPAPRKPPVVFDDEISVVKITPSPSGAAEQRIDEMIFAKSKWQAENPGKRIVACDHVREAVDDYGYCWILHYERR